MVKNNLTTVRCLTVLNVKRKVVKIANFHGAFRPFFDYRFTLLNVIEMDPDNMVTYYELVYTNIYVKRL